MTEPSTPPDTPTDAGPAMRWFLLVAAFLLAGGAVSAGFGTWRVGRTAASVEGRQEAAVRAALAHAEADFAEMQAELLAVARATAGARDVRAGLERREAGTRPAEALVEFVAGLELPAQTAVEVYDRMPRTVAWKGFWMPLDAAPNATRFLEGYQAAVASDGDVRQALVVWAPVVVEGVPVGAVRAMRLVGFRAPVENQYLRSFSLAERWRRATGLPVDVSYDPSIAADPPADGHARLLQGIDGAALGRVVIRAPAPDEVVASVRAGHDALTAFWATLFVGWLVAGAARVLYGSRSWASPWRRRAAAAAFAAAWWGARYALLAFDVPARWQTGKAPLSPLFDPTHLASTVGGGMMRATGDLLLTALFALGFALVLAGTAVRTRPGRPRRGPGRWAGYAGLVALATTAGAGLVLLLGVLTRRAALDSTLDYFTRTGLLPEPLVLVVFCALLMLALAVVLGIGGLAWRTLGALAVRRPAGRLAGAVLATAAAAAPLAVLYGLAGAGTLVPWFVMLAFLGVGAGVGGALRMRRLGRFDLLSLRGVLLGIFFITVPLYALFFEGMEAKRTIQMRDAADAFEQDRDPRILYAIEEVLGEVVRAPELRPLLARGAVQAETRAAARTGADSLATAVVRGSLISSLSAYDVSLTVFDAGGALLGHHYATEQVVGGAMLEKADAAEFDTYRAMYREQGRGGPMIEEVTGPVERARFAYIGLLPVYADAAQASTEPPPGAEPAGWVLARARPQSPFQYGEAPFPRVLLPTGFAGRLQATLSLASFRDGVLVRSLGRDFGRYRLGEDVAAALVTEPEVWRIEEVEEQQYVTFYRRQEVDALSPEALHTPVLAVRAPAVGAFDHLYYLLRVTVCGLFIGLPVYLGGLLARRRAGLLPAPRVRFRDKVLNAFLGVGVITVAAVGYVGLQVVTEETDGAVTDWLEDRLERAEQVLALDAAGDELAYRALLRTNIDSFAVRTGMDLVVYHDGRLVATSRPQLVEDRLIDRRLPAEAYEHLYYDGYRFTHTTASVGSFTYTVGFRALLDEEGNPRYVLSVPTLPKQESIEEERARTVAYLFGALLLLVLVVMLTASLLANALARPIGRLRAGLQAVARGRFEQAIPVSTRDEIGELVETFNEMQLQLAESRRKLAQQERQLAWREMARQVAHEIKNPLTPMKLSVQHLRRAFDAGGDGPARGDAKFSGLFDRITATLIEQIDTLARIANEFSSFARMPTRVLERLDLNGVAGEAVALMQEEAGTEITLTLHPEPLVVEADREEVRRIFINLVKNAIQAIPDDRAGRIEVVTTLEDGPDGAPERAAAYVTDNGGGVPADLRDRIFEPNFSTKTSGTGLGLAIARKSIEEMRGEIDFETEEEVGSTFHFRLPLMRGA